MIKDLRAEEDYYYQQIQEHIAKLENIKANRENVSMDQVRQEFHKQ